MLSGPSRTRFVQLSQEANVTMSPTQVRPVPSASPPGRPPEAHARPASVAEKSRGAHSTHDRVQALGLMAVRRSRTVLTAAMGLVVVAVLWGTSVFGSLATGGAADPRSQSARADALTAEQCGPTAPDLVVLYTSTTRTVDPGFRSWWARDHAEHGV